MSAPRTLQGFARTNASKTHCPKGHPLVAENLNRAVLREGRRRCNICHQVTQRAAKQRYSAKGRA